MYQVPCLASHDGPRLIPNHFSTRGSLTTGPMDDRSRSGFPLVQRPLMCRWETFSARLIAGSRYCCELSETVCRREKPLQLPMMPDSAGGHVRTTEFIPEA